MNWTDTARRVGTSWALVSNESPRSDWVLVHSDPTKLQSWNELKDYEESDDFADGDIKPSAIAFENAKRVLRWISAKYPEPEISTMENGTILLLWRRATDYMTVEIGDRSYGLIAKASGSPTVLLNGGTSELEKFFEERLARQYGMNRFLPVSSPSVRITLELGRGPSQRPGLSSTIA